MVTVSVCVQLLLCMPWSAQDTDSISDGDLRSYVVSIQNIIWMVSWSIWLRPASPNDKCFAIDGTQNLHNYLALFLPKPCPFVHVVMPCTCMLYAHPLFCSIALVVWCEEVGVRTRNKNRDFSFAFGFNKKHSPNSTYRYTQDICCCIILSNLSLMK